ncbi:LysR family transcriptional regulator [Streptomyces pluripotens]|uniref:LysR family transcriptional regulator n=1 Tax=Streptomyces pluripotens TaxID=1355015 RepID=A0A221NYP6_9ACTN|nr:MULTISPECIES: LysR family transcriptional regulator [Streptomyces]ARP70765.1 LysR family transcriptional regulator [Streptomyces pluripotens]ASN25024.1 LysR family transcriptional regulator [Streptomyces pluripotens]KIE27383.1 LysR family transcriptional regulator [Streptomyces sp. MUSC 125]MCH0556532.1 LysR family transcriptional regulator [Streptomyces sp. MUM 16J]
MDMQQMRYVVAVAETRNFTRAAERCSVVQSSLSHRIAALERELGVRLFARSSRRVELTSAGAAFLDGARECLAAADRAVADAAAATGAVRGRLAVGVIVTTAAIDVPELLQRYRAAHPDVHVVLRSGRSDELTAAIRNGELDIAFLGLPEGEPPLGVETVVLDHDEHVLVVPAGHRLASAPRVELRDIAEELFVDFAAGTPGRTQSDQAFAAAGLVREVAYEAGVVELITRLIARGLGVALLPSAFIRPLAAGDPGLSLVPVADGPHRVEYLAWSRFNPSPATRAMLDVLGVGARAGRTAGAGPHPA